MKSEPISWNASVLPLFMWPGQMGFKASLALQNKSFLSEKLSHKAIFKRITTGIHWCEIGHHVYRSERPQRSTADDTPRPHRKPKACFTNRCRNISKWRPQPVSALRHMFSKHLQLLGQDLPNRTKERNFSVYAIRSKLQNQLCFQH